MSQLVIVRHAQASFFAKDYDQLSTLGEQQSRQLANAWLQRGLEFDEIYVGPRKRHRQTADLIQECYQRAGKPWPDRIEVAAFDEHQVEGYLRVATNELTDKHPELIPLFRQREEAKTKEDQQRRFQYLFQAVASLWCQGTLLNPEIESWRDFRLRVRTGIDQILKQPVRARRVALFTSVGPVTAALQYALDCPDLSALELGWRVRNCSVSEFLFDKKRFTLDQFNSLSHLQDRSLWTYR